MFRKFIFSVTIVIFSFQGLYSQTDTTKWNDIYGLGSYMMTNARVYGISFGAYSPSSNKQKTNGIRLQLASWAFLLPLAPSAKYFPGDSALIEGRKYFPVQATVNGIDISPMGALLKKSNGIAVGWCHMIEESNGITFSLMLSETAVQRGISLSGINLVNTVYGGQFGGMFALSNRLNGIQFSLASSTARIMKGLQGSFFCKADTMNGVQIGIINSAINSNGVQIGFFNFATKTKGIQIGLVNRTISDRAFQIGLININSSGFFPIINW